MDWLRCATMRWHPSWRVSWSSVLGWWAPSHFYAHLCVRLLSLCLSLFPAARNGDEKNIEQPYHISPLFSSEIAWWRCGSWLVAVLCVIFRSPYAYLTGWLGHHSPPVGKVGHVEERHQHTHIFIHTHTHAHMYIYKYIYCKTRQRHMPIHEKKNRREETSRKHQPKRTRRHTPNTQTTRIQEMRPTRETMRTSCRKCRSPPALVRITRKNHKSNLEFTSSASIPSY